MKKHQWKVKHQGFETSQAQSRWDQVYQCLLQWTVNSLQPGAAGEGNLTTLMQEVTEHASSHLCTSIEPTSSANPDYRTAARHRTGYV